MNLLEDKRCANCNASLAMIRTFPEFYFYINEAGRVVRDTNPDLTIGKTSMYDVICTNDRTHEVYTNEPSMEFDHWCEEFEKNCRRILMSEELYS